MTFNATKQHVFNRGVPPDEFLNELVQWGKKAPDEIFVRNEASDIYSSIFNVLGPWDGKPNDPAFILHRRAVMLEVMRVLAGFESSWNWNEGFDRNNKDCHSPVCKEAGAWQVSADAMESGQELKELVSKKIGTLDGNAFQKAMKEDHPLAMEFIARLLRRTTEHNGPVAGHKIDKWLRRNAVDEFKSLM